MNLNEFLVFKGLSDKFDTNFMSCESNVNKSDGSDAYTAAMLFNLYWNCSETSEIPNAIVDAFHWHLTPEGQDYWESVYDEAVELVNKLSVTKKILNKPSVKK